MQRASNKRSEPAVLADLKGGLGGSEALAYCGQDPRCSELDLYLRKIVPAAIPATPVDAGSRADWGHRLEPVVREWLEDELDRRIVKPAEMFRSKEVPMMIGHVDGITEETRAHKPEGVEIKTSDKFMAAEFGEVETDQIPVRYVLQVMHYMVVTGLKRFHIGALVGGNDARHYVVDFDPELAGMLIARARAFWGHVESRIPPEVKTLADTKLRWPQSLEQSIVATDNIIEAIRELKTLRADEKHSGELADAIEITLKAFMGESAAVIDGAHQILATWRSQSQSRFDTARFGIEHPELVAQYRKTSEYRVFRLK